LQLYSQLDIKAIHVSKRGTFFALGSPLLESSNMELEGGIFIPFDPRYEGHTKIAPSVYLADQYVP
jgi:hypothetical protein